MKALTKSELDFLLGEGQYYPMPEWTYPGERLTKEDREHRKRYHAMRDRMVKKGFVKITKKGKHRDGGYAPAQFKLTPLAEQIVKLIEEKEEAKRILNRIVNNATNIVNKLNKK
jgi:hypothetical protein